MLLRRVPLVLVAVSTLVIPGISFAGCNPSRVPGIINGNIYLTDGTSYNRDVNLFCFPLDPKIFLVGGDPSPKGLSVKANTSYVIKGLPFSRYSLYASSEDRKFFLRDPVIVEVAKGKINIQDLILVPCGSISGKVNGIEPYMVKEAPFSASALMQASVGSRSSGGEYLMDDGSFLIEGIGPGIFTVYATNFHDRSGYATATVRSGENTVVELSIIK